MVFKRTGKKIMAKKAGKASHKATRTARGAKLEKGLQGIKKKIKNTEGNIWKVISFDDSKGQAQMMGVKAKDLKKVMTTFKTKIVKEDIKAKKINIRKRKKK